MTCPFFKVKRGKHRKFYLANVESIVSPLCVVPDIGGKGNRYFQVRPKAEWAQQFIAWVEDDHSYDEMN